MRGGCTAGADATQELKKTKAPDRLLATGGFFAGAHVAGAHGCQREPMAALLFPKFRQMRRLHLAPFPQILPNEEAPLGPLVPGFRRMRRLRLAPLFPHSAG
ncbi:hypothetical protein [Kallipyga gabonensis]|uniref:hypothetical protein n=1 Tax=Kallipyga gabonensis TaxID=1686287 RepID=UPI0006B536A7|nr:hypothetical protein [Kallipyga gabonensis]